MKKNLFRIIIFNLICFIFLFLYSINAIAETEKYTYDKKQIEEIIKKYVEKEEEDIKENIKLISNVVQQMKEDYKFFINSNSKAFDDAISFSNKSLENNSKSFNDALAFSNKSLTLFSIGAGVFGVIASIFTIFQLHNEKKSSNKLIDSYKDNIDSTTSLIGSLKNILEFQEMIHNRSEPQDREE